LPNKSDENRNQKTKSLPDDDPPQKQTSEKVLFSTSIEEILRLLVE
jgi:hypothetical protein